ncbi:helix-turn-helix domain-containing protein [Streptomyces yaanensis]|uniref:Helix-turn-helix domain-containing protein n=1 Tax=Streptomyces yaanensis TaxID=1142239 RepID=A0ABV7SDN7_9ACTN|nr:helix-turn-helix domain-containing protein [Streptomyces sp. CGMCC 4.7035]WNB99262.1 helix-turn-helix domain-containing protein [Streptomyces sp. CGMCC 4.7035]
MGGRFAEERLPGLADRKRTGRPPSFTALQTAQVAAPACQLPAETGVPDPSLEAAIGRTCRQIRDALPFNDAGVGRLADVWS